MFSLAKYPTYFLSYKTAFKDQYIDGTTQIVLVVRCSSLNFDFTEKISTDLLLVCISLASLTTKLEIWIPIACHVIMWFWFPMASQIPTFFKMPDIVRLFSSLYLNCIWILDQKCPNSGEKSLVYVTSFSSTLYYSNLSWSQR